MGRLDCATHCLEAQDGECLAYEFDKSQNSCKLSDEAAQEMSSSEHSSAEVYTGGVNDILPIREKVSFTSFYVWLEL